MSIQETTEPDHDEFVSLLPWFVNQTLESDQREAVLNHIQKCVHCQSEVEFLSSLNESIQQDAQKNHAEHADIDSDFSGVMSRIDADSHPINTVLSGPTLLLQKLGSAFNFTTDRPAIRWSTTALASLFVAFLGFQLFYGQSKDNYSVLSSSDSSETTMRMSVEINHSVNPDDIQSIIRNGLREFGQAADIERKENNQYIVIFKDSIGVAELSKLVTELDGEEQILRVEILP